MVLKIERCGGIMNCRDPCLKKFLPEDIRAHASVWHIVHDKILWPRESSKSHLTLSPRIGKNLPGLDQ